MLVYSLVPRRTIFQGDATYNKIQSRPDQKVEYENQKYELMGYIDYDSSKSLQQKAESIDKNVTVEPTAANKKVYEEWVKKQGKGWKINQEPLSKRFYATREIPLMERVGRFYSKLIEVDTPWRIHDKSNPDLPRYIKFENAKGVGPALVGSGTKHRYLLYFNGSFPFIHQNVFTLNLGNSYPTYSGQAVTTVIAGGQGTTASKDVTFPSGMKSNSSVNVYSATYGSPKDEDSFTKEQFGETPYYVTDNNYSDPSMIFNSFMTGFIAVILAYLIALPVSVLMARFKDKWFDRGGIFLNTILISLPSLATIYIFRFLGSQLFSLPDMFPTYGASDIRSYIMPTVILAVLNIPGIVIWVRRFMIDQQTSDYVKFARAKGLSEGEISRKHIFKNAMIPISQGIPGTIILSIAGATMTESVFAFPGMGKMLPDSIIAHNNAMVVAITFVLTALAVISVLLGDIVITFVDPRIKLSSGGGK
jgi:oligopeptide transport system permease protein